MVRNESGHRIVPKTTLKNPGLEYVNGMMALTYDVVTPVGRF